MRIEHAHKNLPDGRDLLGILGVYTIVDAGETGRRDRKCFPHYLESTGHWVASASF